jgi:hypothetical protein
MTAIFAHSDSDKIRRQHEGSDEEISEAKRRSAEHRQRCRHLPPLKKGEAERLVAEFLATRGAVTVCRPAYLVPVR